MFSPLIHALQNTSPFAPLECACGPCDIHASVSCQRRNVRTMRVCIVVPLLARCTTRTNDCQWTMWDRSQSVCAAASCALAACFLDFQFANQILLMLDGKRERTRSRPKRRESWSLAGFCAFLSACFQSGRLLQIYRWQSHSFLPIR